VFAYGLSLFPSPLYTIPGPGILPLPEIFSQPTFRPFGTSAGKVAGEDASEVA